MSELQRERRKRGIGGKTDEKMCKRTQKTVRANTTETPSYTSLSQYNRNSPPPMPKSRI